MSVRINVGEEYQIARFRSGISDRGAWEVITVKEEGRSKQEVTIFPDNVPSGAKEGCNIVIKSISGVTRKKKKDSMGNWTQVDVCINAEIEAVEPPKLELEDEDTGDLPFAWGDSTGLDDSPDDLSDLF
jgi:hypothetical protein